MKKDTNRKGLVCANCGRTNYYVKGLGIRTNLNGKYVCSNNCKETSNFHISRGSK